MNKYQLSAPPHRLRSRNTTIDREEKDTMTEATFLKIREDPDGLSVGELLQIRLGVLSKNLGPFSPRKVLDTYLRWLEVQRKGRDTNINSSWPSVITSWLLALRSRKFSREEVALEINHFTESVLLCGHEGRSSSSIQKHLPTESDIRFAWSLALPKSTMASASKLTPGISLADQRPSTECNAHVLKENWRSDCKNPGHRFQNYSEEEQTISLSAYNKRGDGVTSIDNCSTNDNPTYFGTPRCDYICKYCKKRGIHYSLFCPQNPSKDTVSYRQIVKGLSLESTCPDRGIKRTLHESNESERPSKQLHGLRDCVELFTNSNQCNETMEETTMEDFDSLQALNCSTERPNNKSCKALPIELNSISQNDEGAYTTYAKSFHGILSSNNSRKDKKVIANQSQRSEEEEANSHEKFLCELFKHHPSEVVNRFRSRPTAMDMWDIFDQEKDHGLIRRVDQEMAGMSVNPVSDILFEEDAEKHMLQGSVYTTDANSKSDRAEEVENIHLAGNQKSPLDFTMKSKLYGYDDGDKDEGYGVADLYAADSEMVDSGRGLCWEISSSP